MWQRPPLALLYLTIVVIVTWMVEMMFWWDAGYSTYQIVNPLRNLSVSQLQSLLERRGIQHTALLEKSEIVTLLQQSGPVQYGELLEKKEEAKKPIPIELSGKDEYHEQIYEENESVWLVEVIPGEGQYVGHRLLDDKSWYILAKKLQALQINGAVIRCQYYRRFCAQQGWSHPQLVLVMPRRKQINVQSTWMNGQTAGKEHTVLPSTTHLSSASVLSWLNSQLLSRIHAVKSSQQLEEIWFNTTVVSKEKIPRVVYISEMLSPPLLIATLGVRLASRIKLAAFTVKKEEKEQVSQLLKRFGLNGTPTIGVVTAEGVTSYGKNKGESFTNTALNSYMCTLQPQMNDVFLVSLVLANALAVADIFNVFDVRVRAWKHAIRTLIRMLVYNVFVFIVWLAVTAVLKFPFANSFLETVLWMISSLNSTWFVTQFRYHWLMIATHPIIFWISAQIFGIIVILQRVMSRQEREPLDGDSNWWSLFSMDSYLVDVLFRPMASLSRPRPSQDLGLEEGMELLIERLATPDLWLHPVIPNDYMKDLPTWRYDGWGNEDDLKSESETEIESVSDTETDILLDTHACCQEENCRLCELWNTVKEIYVCHRCAILKRKLERQYLRYRKNSNSCHQNITYEKLLKVCENCSKSKKRNSALNSKESRTSKDTSVWLLSPERLTELKWTAPSYAIESRVCAICLGRYRWSAVLCGLPCGHNYHHSCITEWLLKDNHHCPTCRWPSYKNKLNSTTHEHEE